MESQTIHDVFDGLFKFAVNQEVRHKGDTKEHHTDLGLLILKRVMFENVDDDGNRQFERAYYCRMIRFSGSGDIQQFSEKELLSIPDHTLLQLERRKECDDMREEMKQRQAEVYTAFGVTKSTRVYRKDENGAIDESIEYKPTGFSIKKGKPTLSLREVTTLQGEDREFEATSPEQFILVN